VPAPGPQQGQPPGPQQGQPPGPPPYGPPGAQPPQQPYPPQQPQPQRPQGPPQPFRPHAPYAPQQPQAPQPYPPQRPGAPQPYAPQQPQQYPPQPHAPQPYQQHHQPPQPHGRPGSHQPPQAAPLPPPPHHVAPGARQPPVPYRRDHAAPFPPAEHGQAADTMRVWQDPAWAQGGGPERAAVLPPLSPAESALLTAPPSAIGTFKLAIRRAFRLYIDPREVTDAERAALESQSPPITDPDVQGFLAWRRSVHLVVAVAILPLLLFQLINLAKSENNPGALNALFVLHLLIDVGFTVLLWTQLGRWTRWQKQRRILLYGWLAFFLMPFVLYLYPLRSAMDVAQVADPRMRELTSLVLGMAAAIAAMIELAPKAISLMPGLLRGALTSKLLFPGASGPGWLVLVLSPIYALLMYVVLIVPYQLTGSTFFVPAMIGLIGAQIWMGRAGYQLARPENLEEALVLVRKVRATYVALNLLGLLFVAFGVADLLSTLQLPIWQGLRVLVSLLVNVLLLTLIATDQIVANLVRGQKLLGMPGTGAAQAAFAHDIAHFDDAQPPPAAPGAGPPQPPHHV
jgi:hypothetical protein